MILFFDLYTLYVICRLYLGRSAFPPLLPAFSPSKMDISQHKLHYYDIPVCQIVYYEYSCFFFFLNNFSPLKL